LIYKSSKNFNFTGHAEDFNSLEMVLFSHILLLSYLHISQAVFTESLFCFCLETN